MRQYPTFLDQFQDSFQVYGEDGHCALHFHIVDSVSISSAIAMDILEITVLGLDLIPLLRLASIIIGLLESHLLPIEFGFYGD